MENKINIYKLKKKTSPQIKHEIQQPIKQRRQLKEPATLRPRAPDSPHNTADLHAMETTRPCAAPRRRQGALNTARRIRGEKEREADKQQRKEQG